MQFVHILLIFSSLPVDQIHDHLIFRGNHFQVPLLHCFRPLQATVQFLKLLLNIVWLWRCVCKLLIYLIEWVVSSSYLQNWVGLVFKSWVPNSPRHPISIKIHSFNYSLILLLFCYSMFSFFVGHGLHKSLVNKGTLKRFRILNEAQICLIFTISLFWRNRSQLWALGSIRSLSVQTICQILAAKRKLLTRFLDRVRKLQIFSSSINIRISLKLFLGGFRRLRKLLNFILGYLRKSIWFSFILSEIVQTTLNFVILERWS